MYHKIDGCIISTITINGSNNGSTNESTNESTISINVSIDECTNESTISIDECTNENINQRTKSRGKSNTGNTQVLGRLRSRFSIKTVNQIPEAPQVLLVKISLWGFTDQRTDQCINKSTKYQ